MKVLAAKPRPAQVPAAIDITAEIRKELPKALLEKLAEIEKVSPQPVQFLQEDELWGGAQGMYSIEGKIWIAATAKKEWGVVGEELMHFHWRTSGLPRMRPAGNDELAALIDQIGGFFEEHTFFPFLQELGYTPRAAVDAAMPATARDLAKAGPQRVKDEGDNDALRTMLVAKYIQAAMMTSGNTGDQVMTVFDDEALKPYAKIGEAICAEIRSMNARDSADIKERMERTLFTHLKLDKSVAEVKPAF